MTCEGCKTLAEIVGKLGRALLRLKVLTPDDMAQVLGEKTFGDLDDWYEGQTGKRLGDGRAK